jgi:hypothetical protein
MSPDFPVLFERLKGLLLPYAPRLAVKADAPDNFYLDSASLGPNGKPLFFGAAQIRKNYVSFHLMPVYIHPPLLEGISPALRRHMQGKSCFNFKQADEALLEELAQLTARSFAWMDSQGMI